MDWKRYFATSKGTGYLATANRAGAVNIAVYSRPHVLEDGTLAFGMADRLTHANLGENPQAAYAFHEGAFQGVRLSLQWVREEVEGPLLADIRARADQVVGPGTGREVLFVAYFRVTGHRPLVGAG